VKPEHLLEPLDLVFRLAQMRLEATEVPATAVWMTSDWLTLRGLLDTRSSLPL
jgi:hypothetical protein